jgi:hypothetical protein
MKLNRAKTTDASQAHASGRPLDAIAEWAGLHYKKNFDAAGREEKLDLINRYLSVHKGADEAFQEITVERENVRLVLENLGEGNSGDYDPDDDEDCPLARFSIYVKAGSVVDTSRLEPANDDGWCPVQDGSCCTQIDLRLPQEALQTLADGLLDKIFNLASTGRPIKNLGEKLSWTSHEDLLQESEGAASACLAEFSSENGWVPIAGPETGVGTEYWFRNDRLQKEAYVCIDQDEVVSRSVTDI